MSLLTMMQSICARLPLVQPAAVVGSQDKNVQQLLALANQEGRLLADSHPWQNLTKEATFTTVAAESQGSILTLAGSSFNYIINDTIWNRSQRLPIFGPRSNAEWQGLKALSVIGPWPQFRIRGNLLLFVPAPAAGQTCAFEWVTKNWCTDSTGVSEKSQWTSDTDVGMLNESLMSDGVVWRWKAAKGLEYAEDFATYQRLVADAMARDAGKAVLNLGGQPQDFFPGVFVPSGNWNIT